MIKVLNFQDHRAVLIAFWGGIGHSEIGRATAKVGGILREMGHGYTLIESFVENPHFSAKAARTAGKLAQVCYERNRIWRAIQIHIGKSQDPGMCVLHRTRWPRAVPESEAEDLMTALHTAEDEVVENSGWEALHCQIHK